MCQQPKVLEQLLHVLVWELVVERLVVVFLVLSAFFAGQLEALPYLRDVDGEENPVAVELLPQTVVLEELFLDSFGQ